MPRTNRNPYSGVCTVNNRLMRIPWLTSPPSVDVTVARYISRREQGLGQLKSSYRETIANMWISCVVVLLVLVHSGELRPSAFEGVVFPDALGPAGSFSSSRSESKASQLGGCRGRRCGFGPPDSVSTHHGGRFAPPPPFGFPGGFGSESSSGSKSFSNGGGGGSSSQSESSASSGSNHGGSWSNSSSSSSSSSSCRGFGCLTQSQSQSQSQSIGGLTQSQSQSQSQARGR